jgi:uncharacterized protein
MALMHDRRLADGAALPPPYRAQYAGLLDSLRVFRRLLVAYSGGVDSAFLLKAAMDALGPGRVLAVLADSESLPRREKEAAENLAVSLGAPLRSLRTQELQDRRYAENPQNRCYFCKSELYTQLRKIAEREGFDAIADGTNLDDRGDFRPGRQAARERGIVSPLEAAGLHKQDIRAMSRVLGLPTWDKPATPCLASRIPYGNPVDAAKLAQVEAAEVVLQDLGIQGGRVRHHGDIARVELPEEAWGLASQREWRSQLVHGVQAAGFRYVTLDLESYRQGRLNEASSRQASQAPGEVQR